MKITLTTYHGDGSTTTAEHDGDTATLLASIEELLESPVVTGDVDAIVSIGIRHENPTRTAVVLGVGGF